MSRERNCHAIRTYYECMAAGDFATVVELHSPELVCWMSGRSLVSGRFTGRDDLYAHMGNHVLGALITGTEPYVKGSRIVAADDNIVVGLLHGGLPAVDGGRYDQLYLQVFRMENGSIVEIIEMFDTAMVENVLMGNKFVTSRSKPERPFVIEAEKAPSPATGELARQLAVDFSDAIISSDYEWISKLLDANCEIGLSGWTPISGMSNGTDQLAKLTEGRIDGTRTVFLADGAAVVLGWYFSDPAYLQQIGFLLEFSGTGICRISVFFDTAGSEIALFGNAFVTGPSTSIMPPFDVRIALA